MKPWRVATKSRPDKHYGGRVVAIEVPEANLFLAVQTPNGGPDDECDKLAAKIVASVNNAELSTVLNRYEKMKVALLKLEWSDKPSPNSYQYCPLCGVCKGLPHVPSCEIGIALKDLTRS